jgi:hypothetical protein
MWSLGEQWSGGTPDSVGPSPTCTWEDVLFGRRAGSEVRAAHLLRQAVWRRPASRVFPEP